MLILLCQCQSSSWLQQELGFTLVFALRKVDTVSALRHLCENRALLWLCLGNIQSTRKSAFYLESTPILCQIHVPSLCFPAMRLWQSSCAVRKSELALPWVSCVEPDPWKWKGFADHTHHCATGRSCRLCAPWTWTDMGFCYRSCSGLQRLFLGFSSRGCAGQKEVIWNDTQKRFGSSSTHTSAKLNSKEKLLLYSQCNRKRVSFHSTKSLWNCQALY